jgi:hypothetical protein
MEKRLKKTGKVVEYRNLINEIINSAE